MDIGGLVYAGEDSRQVTDEKDDDSRDKNNREITISRLLGCSSLAQFICCGRTVRHSFSNLQSTPQASQTGENPEVEKYQDDQRGETSEDDPHPCVVVDDIFLPQPQLRRSHIIRPCGRFKAGAAFCEVETNTGRLCFKKP